MTQRNSPKRKTMLIERRLRQEARVYGFWGSARQPFYPMERSKLIPAWMNRRTGEPHLHERAKERAMKQWRSA